MESLKNSFFINNILFIHNIICQISKHTINIFFKDATLQMYNYSIAISKTNLQLQQFRALQQELTISRIKSLPFSPGTSTFWNKLLHGSFSKYYNLNLKSSVKHYLLATFLSFSLLSAST